MKQEYWPYPDPLNNFERADEKLIKKIL